MSDIASYIDLLTDFVNLLSAYMFTCVAEKKIVVEMSLKLSEKKTKRK